jgi:uncharacterized membrane protein YfcA
VETLLRPEVLAVLALGASIAGFVDTLAGGGGLITVPLLLLTGLPPLAALATNKVQGSFGTLVATIALLHRRQIFITEVKAGFAASFCGGLIGASAVRLIDPVALDVLIPVILGGIALYFLFAPRAADIDGKPRLAKTHYQRFILPAVGFYDDFSVPVPDRFMRLPVSLCAGRRCCAPPLLPKCSISAAISAPSSSFFSLAKWSGSPGRS